MALVSVSVTDICRGFWSGGPWQGEFSIRATTEHLTKEHTYVAIFNKDQDPKYIKAFREAKEFKIIYEAPQAVNKTAGHGRSPRNTLFVFELA